MDEEVVYNIVMDEKLVQNVAMGEKFEKNFVMDAKIDPKVVMDPSTFKIGGWRFLQLRNSFRLLKLLEEFIEETVLHLIGILNSDSFFVTQYLEQPSVCGNPKVKESKWQGRLFTILWWRSLWVACNIATTALCIRKIL